MHYMKRLAACALTLAAGAAQAQHMLPGQWEISSKIGSSDGQVEQTMAQAQAQLAAMPAEQRKAIEEMMAKAGVTVNGGTAAVNLKVCLTKKMVEQNTIPLQQNGNCKSTNAPITGNRMKMTFSCTTPPSHGEGEVVFLSNTAYTMALTVHSNNGAGKAVQMNVASQGKWLGATCAAGQ